MSIFFNLAMPDDLVALTLMGVGFVCLVLAVDP